MSKQKRAASNIQIKSDKMQVTLPQQQQLPKFNQVVDLLDELLEQPTEVAFDKISSYNFLHN